MVKLTLTYVRNNDDAIENYLILMQFVPQNNSFFIVLLIDYSNAGITVVVTLFSALGYS